MTAIHARNRKLPADHVIRAHIEAGMTQSDIARLYETSPSTVSQYCSKRGWLATDDTAPAPMRPRLCESTAKIIVWSIDGPVSLPRIPVLHGHFGAATPSAAGV